MNAWRILCFSRSGCSYPIVMLSFKSEYLSTGNFCSINIGLHVLMCPICCLIGASCSMGCMYIHIQIYNKLYNTCMHMLSKCILQIAHSYIRQHHVKDWTALRLWPIELITPSFCRFCFPRCFHLPIHCGTGNQ